MFLPYLVYFLFYIFLNYLFFLKLKHFFLILFLHLFYLQVSHCYSYKQVGILCLGHNNRFEFRAVGSEANCASSLIVLNAAVAEALQNFKTRVDALIKAGEDKTSAIIDVVREDIKTCKPIRFDGNGYSDEWKEEAQKRGLDCEASCPVVFDRYLDKESIDMFAKTNVMSESELKARNEVKWEIYTKKIQIEARVMGDLSMNHIIPVATHYQSRLAKNVEGMINIFGGEEGKKLTARNVKIIREIAERTQTIETGVEALVNARKVANRIESEREKAVAYHDTVAPKTFG